MLSICLTLLNPIAFACFSKILVAELLWVEDRVVDTLIVQNFHDVEHAEDNTEASDSSESGQRAVRLILIDLAILVQVDSDCVASDCWSTVSDEDRADAKFKEVVFLPGFSFTQNNIGSKLFYRHGHVAKSVWISLLYSFLKIFD